MSEAIDPPSKRLANPLANPLERVAPYTVRDAILPAEDLAELLAFASVNEPHFQPATVADQDSGKSAPEYRIALMPPSKHFKPWRDRIAAAVAPPLPDIFRDLGVKLFDAVRYEIELVRHNDGISTGGTSQS